MPNPEGTFANIQISKESRKQSAHYLPCNHDLQQTECGDGMWHEDVIQILTAENTFVLYCISMCYTVGLSFANREATVREPYSYRLRTIAERFTNAKTAA